MVGNPVLIELMDEALPNVAETCLGRFGKFYDFNYVKGGLSRSVVVLSNGSLDVGTCKALFNADRIANYSLITASPDDACRFYHARKAKDSNLRLFQAIWAVN